MENKIFNRLSLSIIFWFLFFVITNWFFQKILLTRKYKNLWIQYIFYNWKLYWRVFLTTRFDTSIIYFLFFLFKIHRYNFDYFIYLYHVWHYFKISENTLVKVSLKKKKNVEKIKKFNRCIGYRLTDMFFRVRRLSLLFHFHSLCLFYVWQKHK